MSEQGEYFGIPLFSASDIRSIYPDGGFRGRTFPILDFGYARLGGYREPEGTGYRNLGVALLEGKLRKGSEDRFMKMGLSRLEILFRFPGTVNYRNISTTLLLPENSLLTAKLIPDDPWCFDFNHAYDYDRPDTLFTGEKFTLEGYNRKLYFFVPEDPIFLSTLRFSFSFSQLKLFR